MSIFDLHKNQLYIIEEFNVKAETLRLLEDIGSSRTGSHSTWKKQVSMGEKKNQYIAIKAYDRQIGPHKEPGKEEGCREFCQLCI